MDIPFDISRTRQLKNLPREIFFISIVFAISIGSLKAEIIAPKSKMPAASCIISVLKEQYRANTDFSIGDKTKRVIALLNRTIGLNSRQSLEMEWRKLDVLKRDIDWKSKLLQPQSEERLKFILNRLEPSRLKASSTISTSRESAIALRNWRDADRLVRRYVKENREISKERIELLNSILTRDLPFGWEAPGKYRRTVEVSAGLGKSYVQSRDISAAMKVFLDWLPRAESSQHPLETASKAWQTFTSIHPFSDGNGRTGRLLLDWVLMRNGYPPLGFLEQNQVNIAILASDTTIGSVKPGMAEEIVTQAMKKTLQFIK